MIGKVRECARACLGGFRGGRTAYLGTPAERDIGLPGTAQIRRALAEQLGRRFRHDNRRGISRFFSTT